MSWLSVVNFRKDKESNAVIILVNQNGNETPSQNFLSFLSGYLSCLKNLLASNVPAYFASSYSRYSGCAAKARSTIPVAKWENGFDLSGNIGLLSFNASLRFIPQVRKGITHPPSSCLILSNHLKPILIRLSFS